MKRLIIIRGGGELATGAALYLFRAGFRVLLLEQPQPSSARREVSFADAAYDGQKTVERVVCRRADSVKEAEKRLKENEMTMLIDPQGKCIEKLKPKIVIDAILAYENRGMSRDMAEHTLALGPGFCAGRDVDAVIETMRGYSLGRIIYEGYSSRGQGKAGQVAADDHIEHIVFAPVAGRVEALHHISFPIKKGEPLAVIHTDDGESITVAARFDGVIRGIVRDGFSVKQGQKMADVNPNMRQGDCFNVSDKARCVAGAVLAAVTAWESKKKKRSFFGD